MGHRAGTKLWVNSLTKCLPSQSLEGFCIGIELVPAGVKPLEDHSVDSPGIQRMLKAMTLVQTGERVWKGLEENVSVVEDSDEHGGGAMFMLAGFAVVYHVVATLGMAVVRRIWTRQDHLKVKILDAEPNPDAASSRSQALSPDESQARVAALRQKVEGREHREDEAFPPPRRAGTR